ncbi:MAG TPA: hypothetical protein VFV58_19780 [Blastocatellia bacterium]|nr:hypothetical protein [Blastocatellia bacterium]
MSIINQPFGKSTIYFGTDDRPHSNLIGIQSQLAQPGCKLLGAPFGFLPLQM